MKKRSWSKPVSTLSLLLLVAFTLSFLYAAEDNRLYLPVVFKPTGFFEGPEEVEPNNTFREANGPLRSDKTYVGHPNDANDLFSFYVAKAGKISVDVKNHDVDGGQVRLYQEVNGAPVAIGDLAFMPPNYHLEIANAAPGKYYLFVFVDVSKKYRAASNYSLRISFPSDAAEPGPTATSRPGVTPSATAQPGTTPTATSNPGPSPTSTATATRGPGSISFDEISSGTIANSLERKEFTFSGTAGDKILVRLAVSSGNLYPQFTVHRPNGAELCTAYSLGEMVQKTCTLDTTGLHKVFVSDRYAENTGSFDFYIQRTNNPANAANIPYDVVKSDTIEPPVDLDTFSFDASAGDKVLVRMSKTAGTLYPEFRLFSPDGNQVCDAYSLGDSVEKLCTINSNGRHTLLAGDRYGTNGGSFDFYIQRTNNPANAVNIPYDVVQSDTIDPPVDLDPFSFDASAGDQVFVRMNSTAGALYPEFRLFNPDGNQVCEAYSLGTSVEKLCTINSSGRHLILTGDRYGTNGGSYALLIQRTNNANDASSSLSTR